MSNALRIGNRSISYEQAKEMLFPELIPQKGNEAMGSIYFSRLIISYASKKPIFSTGHFTLEFCFCPLILDNILGNRKFVQ